LPCADVDFGVDGVVEVDHEEEVALVGVVGGVGVLFDLDALKVPTEVFNFIDGGLCLGVSKCTDKKRRKKEG